MPAVGQFVPFARQTAIPPTKRLEVVTVPKLAVPETPRLVPVAPPKNKFVAKRFVVVAFVPVALVNNNPSVSVTPTTWSF
jgi:hypothetical protein